MTQPSKVGPAIVVAFGAVFAAFGIFGATSFAADPARTHGNPVIVCGPFILIGFGIIVGAIFGFRKMQQQSVRQQNNPNSPWLWRDDWAESRAESRHRNSTVGLWIAAIVADAICAVVAILALPKMWQTSDPKGFFLLGFFLFGFILTVLAVRATIRRERFGKTYFEFASLPFSPGRTLKGSIHLHFTTEARHGIDLSLFCARQVVSGSGDNRSTRQIVLWQDSKNVPAQLLTPGPMGDAVIPVEFTIPADAYETNHDQPSDQVLWLLHAQADVPGVDYSDDFEVPVFRTTPATASNADAFSNSTEAEIAAAPGFQTDSCDVAPPDNPKVVVSVGMNGGTEFYFPPFRNPMRVLTLLLVTTLWSGLVYFLYHSSAPAFFAAVFGLFELLLIYGLLQMSLGSTRIEVGNGKLSHTRAFLGISSTREILFSDIDQILPVTAPQQATSPKNQSYSIRLQTKAGKKITLADAIDDRQEARWIAAQLEKFVGLKLDTHVAVDAAFAPAGPPPQRGQTYQSAATVRNSPVAIVIGLALFMAWIGFIVYQASSYKAKNLARAQKSAATRKTPVQRVTYAPFTDRDQQRLQTLSEQAQAEELLDRAIQHDQRALDLFEQNIGIWLGDIKLTDRMKQLEWRSRFSSDLRVRYANADLNLAMDGWAKTENSADLLISRAQTDPSYRQAAVYFMGMLAGRGVAYDQIYPVLLQYATSDPDEKVRLWAVEGMRYLGTDEALDQLFQIFTHDSSNAVRNRAGCNISDCGNFMRKQRMRMVPRLIDLAADTQTSPQMSNWSFLALREITDESLPATASAWQDWYTQHGSDKMAEFEQMDWWKVRGDE